MHFKFSLALLAGLTLASVALETDSQGLSKRVELVDKPLHPRAAPCPLEEARKKAAAASGGRGNYATNNRTNGMTRFRPKHRHHRNRKHRHHHKGSLSKLGSKKTSVKNTKKTSSKPKSNKVKPASSQKKQTAAKQKPAASAREDDTNSGSSSGSGSAIETQMMAVHNNLRAKHNAPALKWSSKLASAAQTWANRCVFEHSGGKLGAYGENIAAGYQSATAAAQGWADEEKDYTPSTGFSMGTGHYTQMVWKSSTELGCAVASCNGIIGSGTQPFYVCEYNPPGNYQGRYDENVQ